MYENRVPDLKAETPENISRVQIYVKICKCNHWLPFHSKTMAPFNPHANIILDSSFIIVEFLVRIIRFRNCQNHQSNRVYFQNSKSLNRICLNFICLNCVLDIL